MTSVDTNPELTDDVKSAVEHVVKRALTNKEIVRIDLNFETSTDLEQVLYVTVEVKSDSFLEFFPASTLLKIDREISDVLTSKGIEFVPHVEYITSKERQRLEKQK